MHTLSLLTLLSPLLSLTLGAPSPSLTPRATWPDTPFTTSGRDILSASGSKVVYAGVNWPGAADTMLPEGLQYNSIANIVTMIKSLGMNVIRLTYAIEMVDDYLGNSSDQTLKATLVKALGATNGATVLNKILAKNPGFTASTTRLQVFDAVAAECAKQQIWVHLDNHVSKAEWCCSQTDGNTWFGDTDFPVYNWQRGLGFMAKHALSWPALASMSLRNELREPDTSGNKALPYDWIDWYHSAIPAAAGIYSNNSLPLIFLSGLGYDTDDTALLNGQNLGGGQYFAPKNYPYGNKLTFELHNYQNSAGACADITSNLYRNGYGAMNLSDSKWPNHAPVVMTEFGFEQGNGQEKGVYAQCIKNYLLTGIKGGPAGWMQWALGGSYYIRTGTQDYDETWGLLNHDWSGWRSQSIIDSYVKPFVQATLA